jgi:hypothetical protein
MRSKERAMAVRKYEVSESETPMFNGLNGSVPLFKIGDVIDLPDRGDFAYRGPFEVIANLWLMDHFCAVLEYSGAENGEPGNLSVIEVMKTKDDRYDVWLFSQTFRVIGFQICSYTNRENGAEVEWKRWALEEAPLG